MPGGIEWVIIAGVIVLLFGGAKLPKLARSLGQAQNEFKKGLSEGGKDGVETPNETPNDSSKN